MVIILCSCFAHVEAMHPATKIWVSKIEMAELRIVEFSHIQSHFGASHISIRHKRRQPTDGPFRRMTL
jgi:hypothetical protein